MKPLTLRAKVAADGTIDLHVPCNLPPGETEVLVTVQPVQAPSRADQGGHQDRVSGVDAGASENADASQEHLSRRISLAKAGEIAHRILLDAEDARLRFAEEEARKGIDWERLP